MAQVRKIKMARDANKIRMAVLKFNLANELQSEKPGLLYIEDLKLSIEQLKLEMKYQEDTFVMVSSSKEEIDL